MARAGPRRAGTVPAAGPRSPGDWTGHGQPPVRRRLGPVRGSVERTCARLAHPYARPEPWSASGACRSARRPRCGLGSMDRGRCRSPVVGYVRATGQRSGDLGRLGAAGQTGSPRPGEVCIRTHATELPLAQGGVLQQPLASPGRGAGKDASGPPADGRGDGLAALARGAQPAFHCPCPSSGRSHDCARRKLRRTRS